MRRRQLLLVAIGGACLSLTAVSPAKAAEYGFSNYRLGGLAFGAGVIPPLPGLYVSAVTGVYSGEIKGTLNFAGVPLSAGAKVEAFTTAANVLYVPEKKLFGGSLGLSVTVPIGHVDLDATVSAGPLAGSRSVDGWGLGDITPMLQLGWQQGSLSHQVYIQGFLPTGRYDVGFVPIIGLNRPGIDTGWTFTWTDPSTKLQFNGGLGITFNFENEATNYRSGNEFHFEWAIGREIAPGLLLGVVGYDYRQITGDSGPGALLGAFKGSVDAIGPGMSFTTLIDKTPFVFSLRHYQEFNVEKRFDGSSTIASGTMRF
jgi:hypothetical protein